MNEDPLLKPVIRATCLLKFATVSCDVNDVLEAINILLDSAISEFDGLQNATKAAEVKFQKIGHALGHALNSETFLPSKFEFPHESVPSKIENLDKLMPLYNQLAVMKKLEDYDELLASCLGRPTPPTENPKKKSYFNKKLLGVTAGDSFDWIYFLSIVLRGYAREHLTELKKKNGCQTMFLKSHLCVL